MTLIHFAILSFRGGALYNYYHHYADKTAMFDFLDKLALLDETLSSSATSHGGLLEWSGYIVHANRANLAPPMWQTSSTASSTWPGLRLRSS